MATKQLYRKFVATASDCTPETPHLTAEGYAFKQVAKLGIAMCMTAVGNREVPREDALGQTVTVTIREAFVDDMGNECDGNGNVLVANPDAHNFQMQTRGFLPIRAGETLRSPQLMVPKATEKGGKSKWELVPTTPAEVAAKLTESAENLDTQAARLRAKAEEARKGAKK